jgi:acyl carrier protein
MDSIASLTDLIHKQYGIPPADIDPDAPFAQYNIDSLTQAELMFAVEDQFHVHVPDEAVTTVTNLRELALLLDDLRAAKAA